MLSHETSSSIETPQDLQAEPIYTRADSVEYLYILTDGAQALKAERYFPVFAMYLQIIAFLPLLRLALLLPRNELSSTSIAVNPVDATSSALSLNGGFAASADGPSEEKQVSSQAKRTPSALESDPPPNTQFQNVAGYPWKAAQR